MTTGPRLSIIPGWIITDPRLKGKDLQVLCMLGRNANTRHGWCRRSQVQLAKALDCSRSTVQAAINRLVEIGAVERREVVSSNGRDSAHWYRVVYDIEVESSAFDAWDEQDQQEFDPNSDDFEATTPAGIPAPPADPGQAPPAGSGPAPINASSLTPPDKRDQREARERVPSSSEGQGVVNAALVKRVQKFCTGDGYREGEWPKWSGSTIGYIAQQFAKLTPEQQDAACEARDVFLLKCERDRVSKPMPVANFFRDLVWEMLTDADRSAFAAKHVSHGGQQVVNGRIAAPTFGPVWSVARMIPLLNGPVEVEAADREKVRSSYQALEKYPGRAEAYAQRKGLWLDADGKLAFPDDFERVEHAKTVLAEGYPEVNRLHDAAKSRERAPVSARYEALKDLVEPVKVGSDVWLAWRDYHEMQNWPWVPDPGSFPVVFFPKGGPQRIGEFESAARSILNARGNDDAA